MTDSNIKRFVMQGESVDVEKIISQRPTWERLLVEDMRSQGWVPLLDVNTVLRTAYNESAETFEWKLTMQAVYVGKVQACQVEGIANNKKIKRSTRQTK